MIIHPFILRLCSCLKQYMMSHKMTAHLSWNLHKPEQAWNPNQTHFWEAKASASAHAGAERELVRGHLLCIQSPFVLVFLCNLIPWPHQLDVEEEARWGRKRILGPAQWWQAEEETNLKNTQDPEQSGDSSCLRIMSPNPLTEPNDTISQ